MHLSYWTSRAAVLGGSDFGTFRCVGNPEGRATFRRFCARDGRITLNSYLLRRRRGPPIGSWLYPYAPPTPQCYLPAETVMRPIMISEADAEAEYRRGCGIEDDRGRLNADRRAIDHHRGRLYKNRWGRRRRIIGGGINVHRGGVKCPGEHCAGNDSG